MAILISILVVIGLAIGFVFALFKYKNRPLQPDYYEYFKTQDTVPVGKVGIFATALIMPENHSHSFPWERKAQQCWAFSFPSERS